jgi:predicted HTH transcriptional regulator
MLIEIPDPEVIFSVIVAFLVGLVGLYAYNKVKPLINMKNQSLDPSYLSKLEHYEKQLIDMKIRLDSLDIEDSTPKTSGSEEELTKILQKLLVKESPEVKHDVKEVKEPLLERKTITSNHTNTNDYVLQLITEKPMTSRDIQITLNKSREHTSRLLKKLFEDGYVIRNTKSKPYTYSISDKGKEKLGMLEASPTTV